MAGAGGTPPLRLKDLLELDCDSCSAAGFRCYPRRLAESAPMRHLLESSPSLRRRPGKLSHLSRSLSRRLSRGGGGFWRRRDVEEEEEDDAAAVPVAATAVPTGCGSSSDEQETSSSESSDNSSERTGRRSRSESDSDFSSATEESSHHPSQAAAAGDEHEVAMKSASKEGRSSSGSEAGDKEQLSPVAVMDFPFDDEEDESRERDAGVACSPSFSLARLQRRKTHKIRRFGSGDELAPMDLEALLATTSDSDPDRPADEQMIQCRTEGAAATPTCAGRDHRRVAGVLDVPDEDDDLISLLMRTVSAGLDGVSERLLLDFFVETKRRRSEARAESGPAAGLLRRKAERLLVDGEAVAAARGWLEGTATQRWGLKDVLGGGADIVAEMGRGRRWMQVGEEEREVVALVTGMMVDQLVGEVVRCLVV